MANEYTGVGLCSYRNNLYLIHIILISFIYISLT